LCLLSGILYFKLRERYGMAASTIQANLKSEI
jgi:hypothetical protein